MRPVSVGATPSPETPVPQQLEWMRKAITQITNASRQFEIQQLARAYTFTNVTPVKTLDCATASATDVANLLATFIQDLARGGPKRV